MKLSQDLLDLLRRPSTCYIATTMPDGSPQLTQTWVDTDGEYVLVNSVQGFVKVRNIERDPRVAVAVSDPTTPGATSRCVAGWSTSPLTARPTTLSSYPKVPRHAIPLVWGPRPCARDHRHRVREGQQHGLVPHRPEYFQLAVEQKEEA